MGLKAVVEDINTVDAAFRTLYTEADGKYTLQVEGMVPSTALAAVKTEAGGYRIELKAAKAKLAEFGDLDPAKTAELLNRIPELEIAAAGKIDDKKLEELVTTRLATKIAPIQRERDTFFNEVKTLKEQIDTFNQKEKFRTVGDAIRAAAKKAGVLDVAMDDAIMLGERVFEVGDDRSVTAKDGVGCTPGIDVATWFAEIQPRRSHWWGPSVGGGANGGKGNGGYGGTNPWANETWNMTEQGKILNADRKKAEAMASAAGTKIGGGKPAPKK